MADRVAEVRRIAIERRGVTPRLTGAAYARAARRARPPQRFRAEAGYRVEGFLFPALYQFEAHTSAETFVANQLAAFEERWQTVDLRPARRRGRTPYEVLTIASMVERETVAPEERRLVAAVIYNRLERDMPLGIDATLRYGLGIPGTRPLTKGSSREQLAVQHAPLQRSSAHADRQPRARIDPCRRQPRPRRLPVLRSQAGQDPPLLHRRRRRVLQKGPRVRLQLLGPPAKSRASTLSLVRDPVTRRNANPGSLPRRRGSISGRSSARASTHFRSPQTLPRGGRSRRVVDDVHNHAGRFGRGRAGTPRVGDSVPTPLPSADVY